MSMLELPYSHQNDQHYLVKVNQNFKCVCELCNCGSAAIIQEDINVRSRDLRETLIHRTSSIIENLLSCLRLANQRISFSQDTTIPKL